MGESLLFREALGPEALADLAQRRGGIVGQRTVRQRADIHQQVVSAGTRFAKFYPEFFRG